MSSNQGQNNSNDCFSSQADYISLSETQGSQNAFRPSVRDAPVSEKNEELRLRIRRLEAAVREQKRHHGYYR
jgi:hypothetical protein